MIEHDTSLKRMWALTNHKLYLVGWYGVAALVLYTPLAVLWLPQLTYDTQTVASALMDAAATVFGLVTAGLAIIIGAGSTSLLGMMYRTKAIHAFFIQFLFVLLTWAVVILLALVQLIITTSGKWGDAALMSLFVYGTCATIDLVVQLIRFGMLTAQEAAERLPHLSGVRTPSAHSSQCSPTSDPSPR